MISTVMDTTLRRPNTNSGTQLIVWKSCHHAMRNTPAKISGEPGRAGKTVPARPTVIRHSEATQIAIKE
jgi:hypothetical protein